MAHAARGAAGVMPLPLDVVYEVLFRLPVKDLCRLRAVCRPWLSLLSDPQFIAAYAARHPRPPLVVAGYTAARSSEGHVWDIVDLSGDVVRRVRTRGGRDEYVAFVHLDFICIRKEFSFSMRLFNMTTGVECALPEGLAEEHAACPSMVALGQVASTGEYKVLRVITMLSFDNAGQRCEILTFDGSDRAQWRRKNAPPHPVSMSSWKRVVIDSIVYFLDYDSRLASFDLDREEWRPSLPVPNYLHLFTDELSLAALNGSLVFVHRYFFSCVNLWFLMDFGKGLWVKKHNIHAQLDSYTYTIYPLLVLDDGRIVLVQNGIESGYLRVYDPRTNTFADVAAVELCSAVGLYYGSPLSLSNRQII